MSENFIIFVKKLTSMPNYMKSLQITDPKKFGTDKQVLNEIKLKEQLKFGTMRSLLICEGSKVVSKITLNVEIFSDHHVTKSNILQMNPIKMIEVTNGLMELMRLYAGYMLAICF
jgi:hypothetical protein